MTRLNAKYDSLEPLSSTFIVQKIKNTAAGGSNNAFRNQYASVYFSRLMALKRLVKENADKRWRDVGEQYESKNAVEIDFLKDLPVLTLVCSKKKPSVRQGCKSP